MTWRNSSSDKTKSVLIAGISARALAQSARRAGFLPLAADFFADADLRAVAGAWRKLPGPVSAGFQEETLFAALEALEGGAARTPIGVVCGSGFDSCPDLVGKIAQRWPVIGNEAGVIARVKDPERFFAGLDALGLSFPPFCLSDPDDPVGWLFKKTGGAGGGHIRAAAEGVAGEGYYQKVVEGRPVSALVLGNGTDARLVGFSEQWVAPGPGQPLRYGGACQPAPLEAALSEELEQASRAIATAFALKGLNSIDYLVGEEGVCVLEVNARPGATLDIFDFAETPLFALHVEAVQGRLPERAGAPAGACAAQVVYAPDRLTIAADTAWPSWVCDRPCAGDSIEAQSPLCTVIARNQARDVTKRLAAQYSQDILDAISARRSK